MNAVLEGQEVTFDEARDDILAEMALDQARRMVLEAAPNIEDLLAGGATLEQVATEAGMELGQIDVDATTQDGIAAYSGFREAALAVQPGDFAELAELDDGGLFALRLDELRAPAPIPLDEARDDVATAWRAAETQRRLVVLAGELLAKLDAGDTLETLGLVVTRHEDTQRSAFIEGLPDAVIDTAFETAQGKHAMVEAAGVHLIRVDAVTPSDTGNADTARLRDMVDQQAAQGLAGDMLTSFVTALQSEAGVTFNTAAINAVHAQMR